MHKTTSRIQIRYGETDQMGVVYHANYVIYLEIGRTDFLASLGFKYNEMEESGYVSPVLSIDVHYKKALRYGDTATVYTWLEAYDGLKMTYGYTIVNENGETAVAAKSVHLCVTREGFRPVRVRTAFPELNKAYKLVLEGDA
ncbi:acyl-CoA thioesterase [Aureibacillus halotolerans]|uniref:Acyl-CoA thioester hydrolase n=1 Tax=Aureibacillus halotolerans TaxID=1508390 RepID=A0A4R6U4N7_9BACI|nr:thioesterase family protein [Aureibacillus halotolerans]TDQ39753.1 acyl-CoA thioester hydrolase [Aureibacillus halotolerans]